MTRAELQTARLSLRPVHPSDEAAVVAALNDLAVSGWLAVVPYPYSVADFHAFQQDYAAPGKTYAICDANGFAGVMGGEDRTLGDWLTPACQGQGFATEAARMLLAEHFADSPEPIASGYFEGNTRSAGVLRKLGFVETGQGLKHCRAFGADRPHVDMRLTRDAFVAALPVEARSARLAYRTLHPTDLDALHSLVSHWDVVRQLASYP